MPRSEQHSGESLAGVILAAGTSSRMGRPKQLLSLGDRPLLQRVVDEAVASGLDEIIVVLGHRAAEIRAALHLVGCPSAPSLRRRGLGGGDRLRIVVNEEYSRGLSSSLRLGLRTISPNAQAAAILLGDQPSVTAHLIDQMMVAYCTADSPIVRPVFRTSDGTRVPGHPVFLSRGIWHEVGELRGDEGARVLVTEHPEWVTEIPMPGEPPADIDTWDDYRHAAEVL